MPDHLIWAWAEEKISFTRLSDPQAPWFCPTPTNREPTSWRKAGASTCNTRKDRFHQNTICLRIFAITQIIWIGKEWFSKLPPDARILKENLSQKNKYKVNCRISWLRLLSVHSWPEILQVWHNLHKKRIDPSARGLSDAQVDLPYFLQIFFQSVSGFNLRASTRMFPPPASRETMGQTSLQNIKSLPFVHFLFYASSSLGLVRSRRVFSKSQWRWTLLPWLGEEPLT